MAGDATEDIIGSLAELDDKQKRIDVKLIDVVNSNSQEFNVDMPIHYSGQRYTLAQSEQKRT